VNTWAGSIHGYSWRGRTHWSIGRHWHGSLWTEHDLLLRRLEMLRGRWLEKRVGSHRREKRIIINSCVILRYEFVIPTVDLVDLPHLLIFSSS